MAALLLFSCCPQPENSNKAASRQEAIEKNRVDFRCFKWKKKAWIKIPVARVRRWKIFFTGTHLKG
jgi:hypothetical protein